MCHSHSFSELLKQNHQACRSKRLGLNVTGVGRFRNDNHSYSSLYFCIPSKHSFGAHYGTTYLYLTVCAFFYAHSCESYLRVERRATDRTESFMYFYESIFRSVNPTFKYVYVSDTFPNRIIYCEPTVKNFIKEDQVSLCWITTWSRLV